MEKRIQFLYSLQFWNKFHERMALFWACNIPLAVVTPLKSSLEYLIFISLMTAFSGEMAALHANRAEIRLDDAEGGNGTSKRRS